MRKTFLWILLGVIVAIGLISVYTAFEYTLVSDVRERMAGADAKDGAALGELLFETRGCAGCHTLGSVSNAIFGPDLSTIAVTASASEIRISIVDPDADISANCPDQPCPAGLMPNFGDILDEREVEALVAFLVRHSGSSL